jgi:hypothetical protein
MEENVVHMSSRLEEQARKQGKPMQYFESIA